MRKALVKRGGQIVEVTVDENTYKTGGSNLIKRKDGSYSQRGLWDNIRANKGSGKKPTKQMLDQAKKITRNKKQEGGEENQFEELLDQIEDALEQGTNLQEILDQLVGMGMDENSAQQLIKKAIQEIQDDAGENEMEKAQKGLETDNRIKRNLVSKSDYEKMQLDEQLKKEKEEKKAIEEKAIRESSYWNNPSSLRNFDPTKFNDPNIQTKVKKECTSGEYVWDYQPCPEEIENSKPIQKPKGAYSNSPTGKTYYINLPNSGLGRSDEVEISPRSLQNYFNNYDLTYSHSGSAGLEGSPVNAYLMYDPNLPIGEYYDLNSTQNGKPIHYYNTQNAQFFPNQNKEMGGDVDIFMQKGGDKKQLSSSVKTASNSDVLSQTRNIITNTGSNNDIADTENFSRITNNYPDKASDTSYMYMYNSATDPSKGINFFYNTSIDPDTGNPIINFNNGQSITPEQEAYYKQLIAAGLNIPNDFKEGGSYRVYKTSERKGKTHKVVGPGGVTKYFGDPKLGERSKSKYGKKGFYARHKKNLDNNPFFRAYARATWAEGGEPSYMNEPEYKTNSFISKVKEMGQMERDKSLYDNIMEQSQQMLMQMGGSSDNYGYVGNPQLDMYQQAFDEFNSKGDVESTIFNHFNRKGLKTEQLLKKGVGIAANVFLPGSGAIAENLVQSAFDSSRPKLSSNTQNSNSTNQNTNSSSGGISSIINNIISNPEMLTSLAGAKKGGTLRKFQVGAQNSVPGYTSDMIVDPYSMWGLNQNNITLPQQPQQYTIADQSLNTPALEPINYFDEQGNYTNFQGPLNQAKQPEITTESTNPIKDPLLKPPTQKYSNKLSKSTIDKMPGIVSIVSAMGNRGKAKKLEAQMADMTASDNVFAANDTLDSGLHEKNTGKLIKGYVLGSNQAVPALSSAKYGGIQKPGVYMSYPTATPESVVYGKPDKKMSNTLGPVDRDKANLEAEGGETVMTPAGDDGIPKFFKIGGKRHSEGGTPLYLPENSFIFSDTRSMLLGKNMLEEFGITGKKKKTPAEVAKILGKGYEKYVKIIQDPNSDSIERRTAEMMIQTQINNLGKLALAQESKKGFPQGIPMISVPYMASIGVSAEQVLPQQPQMPEGMPQGNMMPPEMMQQMQMQQMPMAQVGTQIDKNIAQKIFSGENPITNQKYFRPPAKSVWEQYPEAYSIFQSANQSRNIDDITKAETYLNEIDVPWSIGIPGTDQDIIENAANTLRDRAIMLKSDYEKAKKKYENEQSANKLFSLREQLINIKKGIPKTAENIDKIKELDSAIKDMSVFSPSKKTDYFSSIPSTNSLIANYSELVNKYGKVNSETPVVSESSNLLNTAAPEQTAPVITPSQPSKKTKSVSKTNSSKPSKQTVTMDFFKDVKFENQ
jgi:hypothetical protein